MGADSDVEFAVGIVFARGVARGAARSAAATSTTTADATAAFARQIDELTLLSKLSVLRKKHCARRRIARRPLLAP